MCRDEARKRKDGRDLVSRAFDRMRDKFRPASERRIRDDVVEAFIDGEEVERRARRVPTAIDQIKTGGTMTGPPRLDDDPAPAASRIDNRALESLGLEQPLADP